MEIGDIQEVKQTVTDAMTAESFDSGALPVFATPYLIAMMENAAFLLMQESLPEGKSSVGIRIDVEHVSPTPVGMEVRASAEVTGISADGRIADFRVIAYDAAGEIGHGTHRRAAVDVERFLNKCRGKLDVTGHSPADCGP